MASSRPINLRIVVDGQDATIHGIEQVVDGMTASMNEAGAKFTQVFETAIDRIDTRLKLMHTTIRSIFRVGIEGVSQFSRSLDTLITKLDKIGRGGGGGRGPSVPGAGGAGGGGGNLDAMIQDVIGRGGFQLAGTRYEKGKGIVDEYKNHLGRFMTVLKGLDGKTKDFSADMRRSETGDLKKATTDFGRRIDQMIKFHRDQASKEASLAKVMSGGYGAGKVTGQTDKSVTTEFSNALGMKLRVVRDLDGAMKSFRESLSREASRAKQEEQDAKRIEASIKSTRDYLSKRIPLTLGNLLSKNILGALTGAPAYQLATTRRSVVDGNTQAVQTYENVLTKQRANLNTTTGAFTESVGKTANNMRWFGYHIGTTTGKVMGFANAVTGIYSATQLLHTAFGLLKLAVVDSYRGILNATEEGRQFDIGVGGVAGSIGQARQIRRELIRQTRYSPLTISESLEGGRSAAYQASLAPTIAAGNPIASATLMRQYTEMLSRLERLSPEQGIAGVGIAVREFLSGEARSIRFRLEVPPDLIYQSVGRSQREVLGDPKLGFEALQKFSKIYVGDRAFYEQANLFSVSVRKVTDAIKNGAMTIGESGLYDQFTARFRSLADYITEYISGPGFQRTDAPKISSSMSSLFDTTVETILAFVRGLTGAKDDIGAIKSLGELITRVIDAVAQGVKLLPWVVERIGWFFGAIVSLIEGIAKRFGFDIPQAPDRPGEARLRRITIPEYNEYAGSVAQQVAKNPSLTTEGVMRAAAETSQRDDVAFRAYQFYLWLKAHPSEASAGQSQVGASSFWSSPMSWIQDRLPPGTTNPMLGPFGLARGRLPIDAYNEAAGRSETMPWNAGLPMSQIRRGILADAGRYEGMNEMMREFDMRMESKGSQWSNFSDGRTNPQATSRGNPRILVLDIAKAFDNAARLAAGGGSDEEAFGTEKRAIRFDIRGGSQVLDAIRQLTTLQHAMETAPGAPKMFAEEKLGFATLLQRAKRKVDYTANYLDRNAWLGVAGKFGVDLDPTKQGYNTTDISNRELIDPNLATLRKSRGVNPLFGRIGYKPNQDVQRLLDAMVGDARGDEEALKKLPDTIALYVRKAVARQIEEFSSLPIEVQGVMRQGAFDSAESLVAQIQSEIKFDDATLARIRKAIHDIPLATQLEMLKSEHELRMKQIASGTLGMFPTTKRQFGSEPLNPALASVMGSLGGGVSMPRMRYPLPPSLEEVTDKSFINRMIGTGVTKKGELDRQIADMGQQYKVAIKKYFETGDPEFYKIALGIHVDTQDLVRARDELDVFKQNIMEFNQGVRQSFEEGFGQVFRNIILGTGKVSDAFKQMGLRIIDIFADIQARNLARGLFGDIGSSNPSGEQGWIGSLIGAIFPALFRTGTAASVGSVGTAASPAMGSYGAGLPTGYHAGGGWVRGPRGAGDVTPIMASPGEAILNRSQQSYAANRYGLNLPDVFANAPRFASGGYVPYGGPMPGSSGRSPAVYVVNSKSEARSKGYDPKIGDVLIEAVAHEMRPSGRLNKPLRSAANNRR